MKQKCALLVFVVIMTLAESANAAAFVCPEMPTAVTSINRDFRSDISATVGSLGKIKAGEIAVKTETEAKNLFAKYPNVDKLMALQLMSATYCDILNKIAISDVEKLDRWEKFQDKVLKLILQQSAAKRQPVTSGAEKAIKTPKSPNPEPIRRTSSTKIFVPKEIQFIYVFLQDPNRLRNADGCIPRADGISAEEFVTNFDQYLEEARGGGRKIIITATPDGRDWVAAASRITIDGRPLRSGVEYSCHAPRRDFGFEVLL